MEKFSARQLANFVCLLAFALGATSGCQRKTQTAAPASSPTPAPSAPAFEQATPAAPITGAITPAMVNRDTPDSITSYLHFPRDPETAASDAAVQFYCDVTETGTVEATHALVGKNAAFKAAVQTALDWGRFTPATVNGNPVRVYLGGTVLFLHQNNQPVIVVSLATQDRERVGKLENYIQPQLVGGLRNALEKEIRSLTKGILVAGKAEVVVKVDEKGALKETSDISEDPKDSGLGVLLNDAVRKAHFTPAYENGKAAAGAINIVADFTKF
jgi:hypothetical protein